MNRTYRFQFPHHISRDDLPMFAARIVSASLWEELPRKVAIKLNDALNRRASVNLNKDDFDAIDDSTWEVMAKKLGFEWVPSLTRLKS